ncbi:general substrate transporter [Rhizopus microsporus ATCC 52813]|uniref:General substrate transporter n=1 Tax=Rhizopus microsporus ATCC 52813 TaxID=1340429 RepID=A0A2G4SX40_RHIZD|nr:general substrate transporter [Rhizopus microsporus ATCC 52813]PHZ13339.1 general substrate transporter [Rhizopus microsporus ATCC 52813]
MGTYQTYSILFVLTLSSFASYDSGILTSILVYPSFDKKYGFYEDSPAGHAIISVPLAASFIASFISGFVADALGRKQFLFVASIIHTIGCIVQVAGQNTPSFFAGRILTGLGVGIFAMLVPLYQSEIAKPQNRGRLITMYQIFVTFGFCVAFWTGYGTYHIEGERSWRISLGVQTIPGGLLLFGIYFIPESPRWLIYKDRTEEALRILASLRSRGNENDVDVRMEYTSIVQDVSFDKMAYKHRFLSLLTKGNDNNRKRTLLGIGIHTFTQLSGINAILFYFPHIIESAGISQIYAALLSNGIGGLVNFVATLFVILFIDRWGRRRILITGALGMTVCMVAITIVSAMFEKALTEKHIDNNMSFNTSITNKGGSITVTVLLCIFIAVFALSWGPIGWIYPAEIYPQMLRANAMGVTTSCSYLFSLFIALVSPIMFKNISWRTYLFFACMCLLMGIVVHLFYPETRGRSLEEIQLIFSGALIDQRPDAHHPSTAAEALIQLEHIKHQQQRERLATQAFDLPVQWTISGPHARNDASSSTSSCKLGSTEEIRSVQVHDSIELSHNVNKSHSTSVM